MVNRRTIIITYPNIELQKKYDSGLIYKMFNYKKNDDDLIRIENKDVILPSNPNIYDLDDLLEDENSLNDINDDNLDIDAQIDFQIRKFSIRNKKNLRMNGLSFIKIDEDNYISYEGILGES